MLPPQCISRGLAPPPMGTLFNSLLTLSKRS
uniref:Uncharacterized protein n=1 Tax=Arundo donax TaxID=35708 RepID=A0A0A9HA79_ARUDO